MVLICWVITLRSLSTATAYESPPPPVLPPTTQQLTADDVRARSAFFSEVNSTLRQDETFRRGFIVTSLVYPLLDMLLRTLAIVIAIRVTPAALAAIRSGAWRLQE
jgi:hypothetical protein